MERGANVNRTSTNRTTLFLAFALAVMADPVSSVAYASEAALRALGGHLELLVLTMVTVIGVIFLIAINYWYLLIRFPNGGGDPKAMGRAFGPNFVFPPIAALVIDFLLTIAVSIAAASSALIAYLPSLASLRLAVAELLLAGVAALSLLGHGGRLIFAGMTFAFLLSSALVLWLGFAQPPAMTAVVSGPPGHHALIAVLLAFPAGMALATGIEAPLTSIAQLGQIGSNGKRRFGQGALFLIVAIVGALTVAFSLLATRLQVGLPPIGSTQMAEIARASVGTGRLFGFFQVASSVLLLAAASSSFQAGPGLLKALAGLPTRRDDGIMPPVFARTNRHHSPFVGIALFAAAAALVLMVADAEEQSLVIFYAVAVFVSFLSGLAAMLKLALRDGKMHLVILNAISLVAVSTTLIVSMLRGWPMLTVLGVAIVAAGLYWMWVSAGRPMAIEDVESHLEE